MSRVIYLLGSGASYGTRDEKGIGMSRYSSGMPIMSEILPCLDAFCRKLNYPISFADGKSHITYPNVYKEFCWLKAIAKDNPTIDTYARKLYIKHDWDTLARMKRALSIFFVRKHSVNPV